MNVSVINVSTQVGASYKDFKETTHDISPKGQTQEQRRIHAGQPKCSGAVANYHGPVEAPGDISPKGRLPRINN